MTKKMIGLAMSSMDAELKNRKVRIPEDVIITGYDNIKETKFVSVYSIFRDNYQTGKMTIDMLKRFWDGQELPKVTNISAYVDYKKMNNVYASDIREKLIYKSFVTEKLVHAYISCFVEDSTKCTDFDEYIDVVKTFIQRINPPMFTFTITEEYSEIFHIEDYLTTPMLDAEGNTIYMTNVVMYENGEFIDPRAMEAVPAEMTSELNNMSDHEIWEYLISCMPVMQLLNTPLHFLDKNFGFVSFSQSELPLMANMYWDWIMALNYTINNVYQNILKREVYMHDALTGVYNRLGFEYYRDYFVDQSYKRQLDISIIFADMNGLKPINDNLGHESGDLAICTVAEALNKYSNKRLKLCRYGGDEFIMLGIGYTEEETREMISNLENEIPALGEEKKLDFKVSASIGYYIRKSGSDEDMENCISKADAQMYEKKKKYKESLKNT